MLENNRIRSRSDHGSLGRFLGVTVEVHHVHAPPDPEMRSPAAANGRAKSQDIINTENITSDAVDFQARRLRGLFSLCRSTAYVIAAPAFAGGPR